MEMIYLWYETQRGELLYKYCYTAFLSVEIKLWQKLQISSLFGLIGSYEQKNGPSLTHFFKIWDDRAI